MNEQTRAPKTVAQMLGEVVWLMSQSPAHKQLFIGDLEWFCMPAIVFEQFRIFYGPDAPAAVALWAHVSDDTHERLLTGAVKLRPDEWRGGDNYWLIELIAPFGGHDEILGDLKVSVFSQKKFFMNTLNNIGARETVIVEPETADARN